MNAIVLRNVVKRFRKQTIRRHHTTFKSELLGWLLRRKKERASELIPALEGVDLEIPRGKTVGVIGRNGSGKSTLLKLITGIYSPTGGTVEVNGRISALLDLGAGFHPDFSGRENILINGIILGMSRAEVKARMDLIIEFAELGDFIDEPVRTYSSGMYMRLAFAVATHVDPDILLIDEILAVGDEHFAKKSMAKMSEFKKSGRTIVLVTHDLGTVEKWCDLTAWIDGGKVRLYGDPAFVVEQYRQAVATAEQQAADRGKVELPPPGASLPAREVPQPTFGPKVGAPRRYGTYFLEIERARLLNGRGADAAEFDTEDPMEIAIDFVAKEPTEEVDFFIEIARADGTSVYATNTGYESVRAPRLSGRGVVRVFISRLGLIQGAYHLNVAAKSRAGAVYDLHRELYPFSVRSKLPDVGFTRPPHRWEFDAAEGAPSLRAGAGS
ncbi:MAG: ABC transporter ATP-binding protein [Myxococcales bacterium]|nr:ABC transporter ATP-binding protein [Myxococcales bacterium]